MVLNGPNLNRLGSRPSEHYGSQTLADIEADLAASAKGLGVDIDCRQSNAEHELIAWLHGAEGEGMAGVVLNAGGLSHTSVALRDAVAECGMPVCEVHLSNIHAREAFRAESLLSAVAAGVVSGFGGFGYRAALQWLAESAAATPGAAAADEALAGGEGNL